MDSENKWSINGFFTMMANIYIGQMKRESFGRDDSATKIYQFAIKNIQQRQEIEGGSIEYYTRLYEIADNFYRLSTDPKVRGEVLKKNMKLPEFISEYRERILGDDKRQYDMSELFDSSYIMSTEIKDDGEAGKRLKYVSVSGIPYQYKDSQGNEFVIEEIGRLYMQQWNKAQSYITKYRITRREGNTVYTVNEVYSNISIFDMSDEKYREAVTTELLSERNIDLSNAKGYIGEIVKTPNKFKKEYPGHEETIGASMYFYKINDEYSLMYDGTDLSAVMLHEDYIDRTKKDRNEGQIKREVDGNHNNEDR